MFFFVTLIVSKHFGYFSFNIVYKLSLIWSHGLCSPLILAKSCFTAKCFFSMSCWCHSKFGMSRSLIGKPSRPGMSKWPKLILENEFLTLLVWVILNLCHLFSTVNVFAGLQPNINNLFIKYQWCYLSLFLQNMSSNGQLTWKVIVAQLAERWTRAMVVAQLADQLLPIPCFRSSNPVDG